MNGIYVEKTASGADEYWVVRDVKTNSVLAIGDTVSHAVANYETAVANANLAKELGISLDDIDI